MCVQYTCYIDYFDLERVHTHTQTRMFMVQTEDFSLFFHYLDIIYFSDVPIGFVHKIYRRRTVPGVTFPRIPFVKVLSILDMPTVSWLGIVAGWWDFRTVYFPYYLYIFAAWRGLRTFANTRSAWVNSIKTKSTETTATSLFNYFVTTKCIKFQVILFGEIYIEGTGHVW